MSRLMVSVYALVFFVACSDGPGDVDSGIDATFADASTTPDTGPGTEDDASTPLEPDASSEEDDASTPLEPDAGDEPDAGREPDAAMADAGACFIGVPCNPSKGCPDPGDRCYGTEGNGFCAPFAPECGGFVMTECESGLTCIRAGGSSLGFCATWHETYCICRSADVNGFETDGCP